MKVKHITDKIKVKYEKSEEIINVFSNSLGLAYVLLAVINMSGLVAVHKFINLLWLCIITSIMFVIAKLNNTKIKNIIKYGFMTLLAIIAISSVELNFMKVITLFLQPYQTQLITISISLGIIVFYQNKEWTQEIRNESNNEDKEEYKRKKDFANEYPHINKLPVLRNIVKWMYKEGWKYMICLTIILCLAAFLYFYNLGKHEFIEDEFPTIDVAYGFYKTGTFYKWDWLEDKSCSQTQLKNEDIYCHYNRGEPHIILLGITYYLFGISEFSSRALSAILGLVSVILVYVTSKKITSNKKLAVISCSIFVFNAKYLFIYRYARMYALFVPLFLILFLLLLKMVNLLQSKASNKQKIMSSSLILILTYVCLETQVLTLEIFPAFILSYLLIYGVSQKRNLKKIFLVSFVLLIILLIFLYLSTSYLNVLFNIVGPRTIPNWIYLNYIFGLPFPAVLGVILFIAGSFAFKKIERSEKIVISTVLVASVTLFFIFFAQRYSSFLYVSNLIIFANILILYFSYLFSKMFKTKYLFLVFLIIILFCLTTNLVANFESLYEGNNHYGKYRIPYNKIAQSYNADEIIFGQYLKSYYLKEIKQRPEVINLKSNRNFSYDDFIKDYENSRAGWIVWDTNKTYHIQPSILSFVKGHATQIFGSGIDDYHVEVYHYARNLTS